MPIFDLYSTYILASLCLYSTYIMSIFYLHYAYIIPILHLYYTYKQYNYKYTYHSSHAQDIIS